MADIAQPTSPEELSDALARITKAKADYEALRVEIEDFLYEYWGGMFDGREPETGNFIVTLPHADDMVLPATTRVLAGQIIEGVRSALDYMVFEMSKRNCQELNERVPQFVIAESDVKFQAESRSRLRYLSSEEREFIERIQPYRTNSYLRVISEWGNYGKHRGLLEIVDSTNLTIVFDKIDNRHKHQGALVFAQEEDQAFFVAPQDGVFLMMMQRYDAIGALRAIIETGERIVTASFEFFDQ